MVCWTQLHGQVQVKIAPQELVSIFFTKSGEIQYVALEHLCLR